MILSFSTFYTPIIPSHHRHCFRATSTRRRNTKKKGRMKQIETALKFMKHRKCQQFHLPFSTFHPILKHVFFISPSHHHPSIWKKNPQTANFSLILFFFPFWYLLKEITFFFCYCFPYY